MSSLDRVLAALQTAPSILLTGPIGSDGDSLGASLAVARLLRDRGVHADVTGHAGRRYAFLPGADDLWLDRRVGAHAARFPWHTVVVLDGDRARLTRGVQRAWDLAERRMVVDHHVSTTTEGYDLAWIDADSPSTCQMLLRALLAEGVSLDAELSTLLHTGNVFDTGGFRFGNATPEVFRAAAACVEGGADHVAICTRVLQERRWKGLQAMARVLSEAQLLASGRLAVSRIDLDLREQLKVSRDDLEGIVDHLLFVQGVEVAALLFVHETDIKVSLRSRGTVDVAALAGQLSPTGGGHHKASGARSTLPEAEIIAALTKAAS